jgi:glycosyltransferase involved in cell wall biosynthesis
MAGVAGRSPETHRQEDLFGFVESRRGDVLISVIIPVYNDARDLEICLQHWQRSAQAPHEIIVADDGSADDSASVAERYGARVVSMDNRGGPARARNAAAALATGDVLFFVDADVAVKPDTLERVASAFEKEPELAALIGSYDDDPGDPDFLSQYKNLMHHFVHQRGRHHAFTFWSGCGAIRRAVFLEFSGFTESYRRPAIEDIELGYRLKRGGKRIELDPGLQVKHLKRWTFWGLLKTDVLDRGIPWTELILNDRSIPDDLNLQLSQRVSVALVYVVLTLATLCAFYYRGFFLAPLLCVLFLLLGRYWTEASVRRSRGVIVVTALTLAAVISLSWVYHLLILIPLFLFGAVLLVVRHRYSYGEHQTWARVLSGLPVLAVGCVTVVLYWHTRPLILVFGLAVFALVILNNQFYLFLAAKRGPAFAVAAIPFHLLYHFYNGVSFATGLLRWSLRRRSRAASPVVAASGAPRMRAPS